MSQPKRYDYRRWQLAKGSSITSVVRGIDEDESRICWVGEDDYLRLKDDYDAATKATFEAIRTVTQLRDDYAALAAENERLSKMFADLETPYLSKNLIDSAYAEKLKALAAENERLRKAERLVIWDGSDYRIRLEHDGKPV